jgi:hypothetical protein
LRSAGSNKCFTKRFKAVKFRPSLLTVSE